LDAGTYDVMAQNCDDITMGTAWKITGDETVTVGKTGGVVLRMDNASGQEACYVFISPSSGDSWGEDWMGDKESIQDGESRLFYLAPDTYDLLAQDCDDNTIVEEYDIAITQDFIWTLRAQ